LSAAAQDAAEDLVDLVSAQIRLARLEVSADLRRGLSRVARIGLFLPPLVVGYAFAMAALAALLGQYWPRPVALATVAALQLVVAGLGLSWSLSALRRGRLLERSAAELAEGVRRTLAVVSDGARRSDG
jgi:uncharacterized membrane protein YqjE